MSCLSTAKATGRVWATLSYVVCAKTGETDAYKIHQHLAAMIDRRRLRLLLLLLLLLLLPRHRMSPILPNVSYRLLIRCTHRMGVYFTWLSSQGHRPSGNRHEAKTWRRLGRVSCDLA
jgi:hypothetical protein